MKNTAITIVGTTLLCVVLFFGAVFIFNRGYKAGLKDGSANARKELKEKHESNINQQLRTRYIQGCTDAGEEASTLIGHPTPGYELLGPCAEDADTKGAGPWYNLN